MSNSSRAQDYLMQIVTAGYGFDVPEIQDALLKTNYQSVEAAVEYLFAQQSKQDNSNKNKNKSNAAPSSDVSSKDMQELKERIARMEIEGNLKLNVTVDIINTAIKQNPNRPEDALNYIMDKYAHLIQPNEEVTVTSKQDAQALKQKLIDDALKKKEEQERDEREREKQMEMERQRMLQEEKKKEEAKKRHKQRVEENRKKIAQRHQKQKIVKKKQTLEWHRRQEEYDKKDIQKRTEMERNRLKQTKSIDSPEKAIQTVFERYGEHEARDSITLMMKIISNILKQPDNEKYRRISLESNKIKELIVRPLGVLKFFEFLGFEQEIEKDKLFPNDVLKQKKFLVYKQVNASECEKALQLLEKYNQISKTVIYDYYQQIVDDDEQKINMGKDELYIAFMYLHNMINNLLISPNSQHLRLVEVDNDLFKKRVGRFHILQKLLKTLGYTLENRVKGRVFAIHLDDKDETAKNAQLQHFKNVARDLYAVAHDQVLAETSVGVAVKKLQSLNTNALHELYKYYNTLIKAIDRILQEPLNMKYQSINVEKLKQKYPTIHGVVSVLKLLGFRKDKIDKTKFVLTAEYVNDLDLLKWKRMMFINMINDKKLLKSH
eukprot:CAMPEP_0197038126 /NCGR_PEP_ID=MMETSP1384-20130603/15136_1 /TAXON_ID=29189 /ORGANISM="Ammonia sp." /LENGTH=604 /DNA_ID=CAMNT_0042468521 /DNA_START=27 /DNA_END=1841 /DNA_ORIENTATION=-